MITNPFAGFQQSQINNNTSLAAVQSSVVLSTITDGGDDLQVQRMQRQKSSETIPRFTLKEVSTHTSADDLWMIIHDKVYNVTQFVQDHPGGAEVLFDCAGIDATASFDDVGHSSDAVNMLDDCLLGELTDSDKEFLYNINNIGSHESSARRPKLSLGQIPSQPSSRSSTSTTFSSSSASQGSSLSSDKPQLDVRKKKRPKIPHSKLHKSRQQQEQNIFSSSGTSETPVSSPLEKSVSEQLVEKLSVPVLLCISISALTLYVYLQTLKVDYHR